MSSVLIVDDDPAIRGMLVELLSDEGYDTFIAGDGHTAVEMATIHSPDVILMDLMLPIMDGASATRLIKANPKTAYIRVIAMSAGSNLRRLLDDIPADGVVSKPFDLDALLADVVIQLRRPKSPKSLHTSKHE
ncbi:MAG TPA: response regulator [Nitrolancea sp.]|nr:response regulator [Nitrolancea sp.]